MIYKEVSIDGKLIHTECIGGKSEGVTVEHFSTECIGGQYVFNANWHWARIVVGNKYSTMKVIYSPVKSKKKRNKEVIRGYIPDNRLDNGDICLWTETLPLGKCYKAKLVIYKDDE